MLPFYQIEMYRKIFYVNCFFYVRRKVCRTCLSLLVFVLTFTRIREIGGIVRLKRSLSVEELPEPFIADRPFVWLLRHEITGAWIFFGRIVNILNPNPVTENTRTVDEL